MTHAATRLMVGFAAWLLCLGVCTAAFGGDSGNLTNNGTFTVDGGKGIAAGWLLSGAATSAELEPGGGQRVTVRGEGQARLSQAVAVEPGQVLFFNTRIKSPGRAVVRLGEASLSYHDQGEWQQVSGLTATGTAKTLEVVFQLSALDGEPAEFEIRDVVLRPAVAPPSGAGPSRAVFGQTTLAANGQAAAAIVYPSDVPEGRALAERVQAAAEARTGVSLPIVSDAEATEAGPPVLRPEFRDRHLILIGRLGTNRAFWVSYNRFLSAADGYYPGGDGYVVRTAANVLRNGKNHLILGGSSERGVERAVERFVQILEPVPSEDSGPGKLTLPWLLDVELGGACLTAFQEEDRLWASDPHHARLPPTTPGYGTVRRWYQNAMGYYWSGWDSYRERALANLEPVLKDRAYTHHYIAEFFVRTWDMLDDSPLYNPDQRAAVDSLILRNFWEFSTGPDASWMTTFSPPYEQVQVVNRHQIAPWMADVTMAQFLHDYFELEGELGTIVDFRLSEKRAFMDHVAAHRWSTSSPAGASESDEHIEELVASIFRYALEHELYEELFVSGHARMALHLDQINHLTGRFVRPGGGIDYRPLLGILAHYYRDGRYAALLERVPFVPPPTGPFQGRYVNGVHRYAPGPALAPESLETFTGLRLPGLMPHATRHLSELESGRFTLPEIDPARLLNLAVFRGGFEPEDDYLFFNGLAAHALPGAVLQFSSQGTVWLGGSPDAFGSGSDRYFDANAVHVVRTDRWQDGEPPYAAAAELDWSGQAGNARGVAASLEPFVGTRWQRQVVRVRPGLFVVRDTITALEDGSYRLAVTWRPTGGHAWDGRTWTSTTNTGQLRITPLGAGWEVSQNLEAYQAGDAATLHFRQTASATLGAGQSRTAVAVLQALRPKAEPAYRADLKAGDRLVLTPEGDGGAPIVVQWGPSDGDAPRTDAQVLVAGAGRLDVLSSTRLDMNGDKLLGSPEPVSRSFEDAAASSAVVEAAVKAGPLAGGAAAEDAPQPLVAADRTAEWREAWSYAGLQKPARVEGVRRVAEGVADLGRVVELAEVRAVHTTGPWEPSPLPEAILTAMPDEQGRMPALDSDAWRPLLPEPIWRPGVRTANYGGAEPVEQAFQAIEPSGVRARYVRAPGAESLLYFDRGERRGRRPLRLEVADADQDGSPEVLVKPYIWPKFIRSRQAEDDSVALLGADGSPRLVYDARTNLQSARLLDTRGDGGRQVVVVEVDGPIRFFDARGEPRNEIDLYALHQRFHAEYGRSNTRHPAGGLTMPYSIGLWRQGPQGLPKLVVSRYGALSFLTQTGELEGVLMTGGYVLPHLLPDGIDFDGDGRDEQLCLGRGRIFVVGGEAEPYVTEPGGSMFYPQVYEAQGTREPDFAQAIDGAEVLAFRPLPGSEDQGPARRVFVARDNYLGIYDAAEKAWAFEWVSLAPLEAAAVWPRTQGLSVVAATADGLLWTLTWDGEQLDVPPRVTARPLGDPIDRIVGPEAPGQGLLLVGPQGLDFLPPDGDPVRIAAGPFTDAAWLSPTSIVAARGDGGVIRLDRVAGSAH